MSITNSFRQLKEITRLKQALSENPKDTDALFKLAMLMGTLKEPDLDGQRKLLNTILSIEPSHQKAREMLLAMERAEMSKTASQPASAVISVEHESVSTPIQPLSGPIEKAQVFRYSILLQIVVYLTLLFALYLFLSALPTADGEVIAVLGAFLVFLVIPLWFISAKVEASHSGLKLSRLFGIMRQEVGWNDIERFQSNALGQGIKLRSSAGKVLEISSQIGGYSGIIEILRQMRPDLFNLASIPTPDGSSSIPATKIFEKSFFLKYGPLVLLVLGSLVLPVTVVTAQCIPAAIVGIVLFFLWRFALYTPYSVKMEEHKLWTHSFLKKREVAPEQIKDIRIVATQTRRGFKRNHLQIDLLDADFIYLSGFPEGNEIMYGFLKNWWTAAQNT